MGASDVVTVNLTDTDDVDGSYTVDPNGAIDLPFIGKIKIEGYDINKESDTFEETINSDIIFLCLPTIYDSDTKKMSYMYPNDARLRSLTYAMYIFCNIGIFLYKSHIYFI